MKVLVSGASGLVGGAVASHFRGTGHEVLRLVRGTPRPSESRRDDAIHWDPLQGTIEAEKLDGVDLVVHLAGESLMGLWTAGKRRRIHESRVVGTRSLCDALGAMARPPATLLCASAVGYYGHQGEEVLTEDSARGEGFLAEVCDAWEAATEPASRRGVRVVNLRFGVVLSAAGGALRQMLRPFRMGLGGRMGDGSQYMSWVALTDAVLAVEFAATTHTLRGPVNVTAPHPVTNSEFTHSLKRAVHRPALLPVPGWALRLILGEMADEMLLSSVRAFPQRLQAAGFKFLYEEIDEALAATV